MLAAGQVLGGHPIVGVWISTGLACAAICWMLLTWLPAWWAVIGGLLAALHPLILLYWSQSYWGGAMAVIGGALVVWRVAADYATSARARCTADGLWVWRFWQTAGRTRACLQVCRRQCCCSPGW